MIDQIREGDKLWLKSEIKHPAMFPSKILIEIRLLLNKHANFALKYPNRLLDPFAGVGTIADIGGPWICYGVEIEPEWAQQAMSKGMTVHIGSAEQMPWVDHWFAAIATSPAYGNRLADSYAPDLTCAKHGKRRTYRIALGRNLTTGNGAAEQWGDQYRAIHAQVWRECFRVLQPDGILILNCKDHIRAGEVQKVTDWHTETISKLGFEIIDTRQIPLKGDQNTNMMRKRGITVIDYENIIVFRRP